MYTIVIVKFSDWLNEQFFLWRGNTKKSVTDFAEYVGISQQVMDKWMNPKLSVTPTVKTLVKLADKYPEVYDVLNLPPPKESIDLDALPEGFQYIREAINEAAGIIREKYIPKDSDEAEAVVKEVFYRYGLTYIKTTREK